MQSPDIAQENLAKLKALFPECITERKSADGKTEYAVDADMLTQLLNGHVVANGDERYQFTWPGKNMAIAEANKPCNKTLVPSIGDSVNFRNTQNLYIEGENLEVLKLLRETYLGQVKMIYLDPPYNTGNDFIYHDNFSTKDEQYREKSGDYDEEGKRYFSNSDSTGRFHSEWLNMIYPRIQVCRDLLKDTGVIFISIDDKEVDNLKKVCTEIFGEQNFVGNIVWQSRTSISNDDEISTNHNHTLVYSKDRSSLTFGGDDIDESDYVNPDNDPRGPWKLVPIDANHVGGNTSYPIRNPKNGIDYYPPNGRVWCYNEATLKKLQEDGRIKFGLSDDSAPKRKLFYRERMAKGDKKTPSSLLLDAGTTKSGTTEIMDLFNGRKVFDYPKPTSLILRLLKYGFVGEGEIFMDFFSGSATSLHALFKYEAERDLHCKGIMVQYPENLDKMLTLASTDAKKTIKEAIKFLDSIGKPHFLTEIAKERIRRAGKVIKKEHSDIDCGFRVLKLVDSNMKDIYYSPSAYVKELDLFDSSDNIKSDRTDEDLLFQVMPEMNIPLSAKIEKRQIRGKDVFFVDDNYMIASFAPGLTDDIITEIAKMQPMYFVMADRSAASDSVISNFDTIFKQYSSHTTTKII